MNQEGDDEIRKLESVPTATLPYFEPRTGELRVRQLIQAGTDYRKRAEPESNPNLVNGDLREFSLVTVRYIFSVK